MPFQAQPYRAATDIPGGLIWTDPDAWSVIVPEATTNLITNPTPYSATTGYTAVTATLARVTTATRRSVASLSMTPSGSAAGQGVYYGTVSLTSGTAYTFSLDLLGVAGIDYEIYFATTGGVLLGGRTRVRGTGFWQRASVTYRETSSTTRRLYLVTASASSRAFFSDGWQLEAKAYPTTYTDGAQQDVVSQTPAGYLWTGVAYASTSTRSAQTRAGGRRVKVRDFGLTVLGAVGLGMPGLNVVGTPYGLIDGGLYQRTIAPPREFALVGRFDATTPRQLQRNRSAMLAAISRDITTIPQPVVLAYLPTDCGVQTQEEARLIAAYLSGLEGEFSSPFSENVTVRFRAYSPWVQEDGVESTGPIGAATAPNTENALLLRSAAGVWSGVGNGPSFGHDVNALVYGQDGKLYVGGSFTDMNSVANTPGICVVDYDGTVSALGTGAAGGAVLALCVGNDGTIYAGGTFTSMGGIANTDGIAQWNGSAWSAMGTGISSGTNEVDALATDAFGHIWAGGRFSGMGGVGSTAGLARWRGALLGWVATAVLNGTAQVFAITRGPGTFLYIGGAFTEKILRYTVSSSAVTAIETLSTAPNGDVYAIEVAPNGIVYAGGAFTTIGGISAAYVAQWNGSAWTALGSGFNNTVYAIRRMIDGMLMFGGAFTTAGGRAIQHWAIWNGSDYVTTDRQNVTIMVGYAVAVSNDGRIAQGSAYSGNDPYHAVIYPVTNTGTATVAPTIRFTPSDVLNMVHIWNVTTDQHLWIDVSTVIGYEVTIVLTPGSVAMTTPGQGSVISKLLPGSDVQWRLAPGVNQISLWVATTNTTYVQNPILYQSMDDLTP